jgi:hypothetical protein
MKITEVSTSKSQHILNESWNELTESQHRYLGKFEHELWPLMEDLKKVFEADLTASQIQSIFQGAEASAKEVGGLRTGLGKAADVASIPAKVMTAVHAKLNELGKMAQATGPVKNADAKFEELKRTIGAKDSKLVDGIKFISDWAKKNPGKASLAVGILTAVAAFAGGPAGGAAAGFLVRSSKDLLQGAKLSSAVGKAFQTAAYGAIAGWALEGLGNWFEGLRYKAVPFTQAEGLTTIEVGMSRTIQGPGYTLEKQLYQITVPAGDAEAYTAVIDDMKTAFAKGDPKAVNIFTELYDFGKKFSTKQWIANMNLENDVAQAIAASNDKFLQGMAYINKVISTVAQSSMQTIENPEKATMKVDGKEMSPVQESKQEALSYEELFALYEADPPSSLGAKLGKGISNLTNKVTVDKLTKQWKKMGEPKDMGAVVNILANAGLTNQQIADVGSERQIQLPKHTVAEPEVTKTEPATMLNKQVAKTEPEKDEPATMLNKPVAKTEPAKAGQAATPEPGDIDGDGDVDREDNEDFQAYAKDFASNKVFMQNTDSLANQKIKSAVDDTIKSMRPDDANQAQWIKLVALSQQNAALDPTNMSRQQQQSLGNKKTTIDWAIEELGPDATLQDVKDKLKAQLAKQA